MKSIEQKLIKREIIQRQEEGCDTTSIENRLETLQGSSDKGGDDGRGISNLQI